jgi:outer membrane protein assembly factor BamB
MENVSMQRLASFWAVCLFLSMGADTARTQEWPRFRGPNGSGLSASSIPVRWTEKEVNWKVTLPGIGHSSPVLWGERIFVTSGDEKATQRLLLCLHAADGRVLWSRAYSGEPHRKHADNSLASATPVVDQHRVYVCWGSPKEYRVVALDHVGREEWRVDLGPYKTGHGFGVSPIPHGDLLIVPNEQDGKSEIVALEQASGKVRWRISRRSKTTYSTPCIFQTKDRSPELILTSYEHGITSLDPATGRTNWEIDVFDKGHIETSIGSPIVAGDLVIGMSGWLGVKKEVIALRPDQTSKPRQLYRLTRSAPLVTTPLVKDGLLFLWSDEGVVTCASVETGEVFYQERVEGRYYASPVCAGTCIYNVSRDGDVLVLAASKKFELLARNALGEGSHSTPAIAGGKMYVRTFGHLMAIGDAKRALP